MPQYGYVVFYSTDEPPIIKERLRALLDHLGIRSVFAAMRTMDSERGWEYLQRDLKAVGDESLSQSWEHLNVKGLNNSEISDLCVDGTCLFIEVGVCDPGWGDRIKSAVERGVALAVRGRFTPCELYLRVGYHDIIECSENDDGLFVARASFSVEFFGYNSPHDWAEMRQQTFRLPEVVEIKRELEKVLGHLDEFMFWDV
jgi:hypothetical protein